jgi:hypothetical protein
MYIYIVADLIIFGTEWVSAVVTILPSCTGQRLALMEIVFAFFFSPSWRIPEE